ncbi:Outer membrane cobalamin receptor protein [Sinomicrobium oceani]|uniref:Outer membrane cobalamin receptor protein n=1 Tax=Sinomicrobium oceani TaxID=1150368 RepID=A0A1K1PG13_9FLAO|nr:TonB-dependent receptor [Sinomicrobium oceani]SFW46543.1 Outer membrane cobalamin receptor protein [Sinomicrobium oceani]
MNLISRQVIYFLIMACCGINLLTAQHSTRFPDTKITLSPGSLKAVLQQVQEQTSYSFAYNNDDIDHIRQTGITQGEYTLSGLLRLLQKKHHLYFQDKNGVIYVRKQQKRDTLPEIRGQVLDENGDPLPQANIIEKGTNNGVVSDFDGYFTLIPSRPDAVISVSYLGYITRNILADGSVLSVTLDPNTALLDEVVVTRNRNIAEIKKPQMSVSRLSSEEIKRIPVVLGESDPLKSLMQLPGITNAGEASSGFNVRGGAADQNLILLDGSPVFGDSHLFGFFSVFNPDVVQDMELYKGGIPARFGGRVSSVLDVHQKTGNSEEFHMNGGIGAISSRLMAEGPFANGKGSFIVAGRSSYAHLFLKLSDNDNSGYFYDLNTKISYRLNDNNSIFLSGYFGRDVFDISNSFSSSYGNAMFNLRWNHRFSENLLSDLSVIYSDYRFGLDLSFFDFEWNSNIETYSLKYDMKYYVSDRFTLQYGANAIYYDFNPGTLSPNAESSSFNYRQLDRKYAIEPSFYIDAEHTLSDKLALTYGLRYSMFQRYGKEEISIYENGLPLVYNPDFGIYEEGKQTGSRTYGSGDKISGFDNLEPRAGLSYAINDNSSVKASYNRMSQYLHLLSNTQSPTPVNVWTPSGPYIKPQILDQVALGYFRNFKDNAYTIETEVFYKKVKNRIDYIDNADLIGNNNIEREILNGKARSYGLEFLLRKNTGKLTGWIAYTLSRAEQQTPGRTPEETGINNGDWYLSAYDKLHNLTITGGYELNKKWSFGANFTYQTGQPVTFPKGRYEIDGISVPNYVSRNEDRLPAYHHLDVSATYVPKPYKKKGWQGEWVFGIYNLYSRKNAASISFRSNEDTGANEAIRLSIFGIIPSVTYNFKF